MSALSERRAELADAAVAIHGLGAALVARLESRAPTVEEAAEAFEDLDDLPRRGGLVLSMIALLSRRSD